VKARNLFCLFLFVLLALIVSKVEANEGGGKTVFVKCSHGETITEALQKHDSEPLTIKVSGICNENVEITRDDVALLAASSGATINGPDSSKNTVYVTASRTLVNGLIITGGRHGISVHGSADILNSTIQNTGRSGIDFFHGGQGLVDNCLITNNPIHGIHIEGASATVTNSNIASNGGAGIDVTLSGSARIGITDRNEYAGNTIVNNQGSGIVVHTGGNSFIGGNTIQGNGTNLSSAWGQYGIDIDRATATVIGYNTITQNAGSGIFARASTVLIGETAFGLPITGIYANVITGNGATAPVNSGIYGFLGTNFDIRSATISNNTGNGVTLTTRSTARMYDDTISNNTGNGIWLALGGGLLLQSPPVAVTGNPGFGISCVDGESSYYGDISGISGNTAGQVNCSGF
jgi:parallel beta-helix repeat protein